MNKLLVLLLLASFSFGEAPDGYRSVESTRYVLESLAKIEIRPHRHVIPIRITNRETRSTAELHLDWLTVGVRELHLRESLALVIGSLYNQNGVQIVVIDCESGAILTELNAIHAVVSPDVRLVFYQTFQPRGIPAYARWPEYNVLDLSDPAFPSYRIHPLEAEPPLEYDPYDNPPEELWRVSHRVLAEGPLWTWDGTGILFLSKSGKGESWMPPYELSLVAIDFRSGFDPMDRVVHTFDHMAWFVEEQYLQHWDAQREADRVVFPVKAITWIDEQEAEMTLRTGSFFYWEYDTFRTRWDREAGSLELFPVDPAPIREAGR